VAAEQGLIGLAAYLALLVLAFVRLLRGVRGPGPMVARVAVVAAFTALVAHSLMYAAFLEDPLTWTLLGVGTALAVLPARVTAPEAEPPPPRSVVEPAPA